MEDDEEEEEEEEEATESYCSSDPLCPGFGVADPERASAMASAPVEQKAKMSRVLAWRNSFDSVTAEDNSGMFPPPPARAFHHTLGALSSLLPLATSPRSMLLFP